MSACVCGATSLDNVNKLTAKCSVCSCPAWEDGKHCFAVQYERDCEGVFAGGGKYTLGSACSRDGGDVRRKVCACGAEVKRVGCAP